MPIPTTMRVRMASPFQKCNVRTTETDDHPSAADAAMITTASRLSRHILNRKLDHMLRAVGRETHCHRTLQLLGRKGPDQLRAKRWLQRSFDRRAAALAPVKPDLFPLFVFFNAPT